MKVVVIRHGERDYEPCKQRGFIGQGLELAALTETGVSFVPVMQHIMEWGLGYIRHISERDSDACIPGNLSCNKCLKSQNNL
jgi:hypothetical protein